MFGSWINCIDKVQDTPENPNTYSLVLHRCPNCTLKDFTKKDALGSKGNSLVHGAEKPLRFLVERHPHPMEPGHLLGYFS